MAGDVREELPGGRGGEGGDGGEAGDLTHVVKVERRTKKSDGGEQLLSGTPDSLLNRA